MSDLKSQLIKLGSTNPELQEHIKPILTSLGGKTASGDILWSILDRKAYMRLYEEVDEMDEQSSKLLYEIMRKLQEALSLSSREEQAFNRLQGLLSRNMDIGNRRNQIFKIADLLGIKLPSAMF